MKRLLFKHSWWIGLLLLGILAVPANIGLVLLVGNTQYQQGHMAGSQQGYQSGYTTGQQNGYTTGHQDGYTKGYSDGSQDGYTTGYSAGKNDGAWAYIQQNCMAYPFALLDPLQYWACRRL